MDITNLVQTIVGVVVTAVFAYFGKSNFDANKSQKLNESIEVAEKYAKDIVITLSQKGNMSNSQKFKQAYIFVVNKLKAQNIHVTAETIENKINSAYQLYKMDGGDIHKFIPDFTQEAVSDVEKAVLTPESRMVQQPSQSVQSTSTSVDEAPVEEPKEDAPKVDDSIKIDEPKTDAPVENKDVQSAPVNPYVK